MSMNAEPFSLSKPLTPITPFSSFFSQALGVGTWYFYTGHDTWQTMVFTTLAFLQVWQTLASRSTHDSFFTAGPLSNPLLLGMAGLTFMLQVVVIYMPALQGFFKTVPLSMTDFAISLTLSSSVFIGIELEKLFARRNKARKAS